MVEKVPVTKYWLLSKQSVDQMSRTSWFHVQATSINHCTVVQYDLWVQSVRFMSNQNIWWTAHWSFYYPVGLAKKSLIHPSWPLLLSLYPLSTTSDSIQNNPLAAPQSFPYERVEAYGKNLYCWILCKGHSRLGMTPIQETPFSNFIDDALLDFYDILCIIV